MRYLRYLLLVLPLWCGAQKQDYVWLFGYGNKSHAIDSTYGGCKLDFNTNPPQTSYAIKLANFDACNVSYCDGDGNLRFYSNCGDVFDASDSIMQGGDKINLSPYWYSWQGQTNTRYDGLAIVQGIVALPSPADSSKIYLHHYTIKYSDFHNGISSYPTDTSYYTLIDINSNNGLGSVIEKNKVINDDTLTFSMLSAVKHGNGKDWWILHPYYTGNCYYKFMLDNAGMRFYDKQCLGGSQEGYGAIGGSCFSPDGSKYFWVNAFDGIHMFNFDRCSGDLSDPQIIPWPFPSFGDSVVTAPSVAVSPNNRYLYVAATSILLQYDLQATNIGASVDTVGIWDGYTEPLTNSTFGMLQAAPDGKIYINTLNIIRFLHVINRPDEPGDSCLFVQRGVPLPTKNSFSMPNFPNYRLGALSGSACDTVTTATDDIRAEKEKQLKVYPNPTTDVITIDYGYTNWNKGEVQLEVTNAIGETVYSQTLPMYSGYQQLNVNRYPAGLYTAIIKRNGKTVAAQKWVKE